MSLADVLNFSDTTPAAPSGQQLIVPQNDAGSPTANQTFYDPLMVGDSGSGGLAGNVPVPPAGSAAAGKYLKADGTFAVPPGTGFANPMTTEGDMIYGGSSGTPTRLAGGTAGYLLSTDGSGGPPSWVAAPSGVGTFTQEVVTFSGTSGTLAHTPVSGGFFALFRNGLLMIPTGSTVQSYSISGASITLSVAAGSGDSFYALYYH